MIKKGHKIEGLGITFKENCPDIRNSRCNTRAWMMQYNLESEVDYDKFKSLSFKNKDQVVYDIRRK